MEELTYAATALVPLLAVAVAAMGLRQRDLTRINERLSDVEGKLAACEEGRYQLRNENIELREKLAGIREEVADVKLKLNGGL